MTAAAASRAARPPGTTTLHYRPTTLAFDGHAVSLMHGSGWAYKHPGRVGDSPIVGAGLYNDGQGAAVATGDGEEILRVSRVHRSCRHTYLSPASAHALALR